MKYDPYASHFPALTLVLRRIKATSILEIGCGFYSTPLLGLYSLACNGEHRILETNQSWCRAISDTFNLDVELFQDGQLPSSALKAWDLVFIDSAEEKSRAGYALSLHDHARAIIMHDSNPDWDRAYGYSSLIPMWKHHTQFTICYPHTLLLTNNEDIWDSIQSFCKH